MKAELVNYGISYLLYYEAVFCKKKIEITFFCLLMLKIVGTNEATTCVGIVIWNSKSGM